jgi:hypothetical protein
MKTLVTLITLGLTITYSSAQVRQNSGIQSQVDWSPEVYQVGKKYSGYIIKLDGDTVNGYIKALQRTVVDGMGHSNQNRVYFYVNESDRKPQDKYKPNELKGYLIADKLYESINYSGGLFNKPNFNIVIQDGAIRQYEWYSTRDGFSMMKIQSGESWAEFDDRRYETKLIIAKEPTDPIEYGMLGMSFAKKMPIMIHDHKELTTKVENKEEGYKWTNFFEVIDEYNAWAAENNK